VTLQKLRRIQVNERGDTGRTRARRQVQSLDGRQEEEEDDGAALSAALETVA